MSSTSDDRRTLSRGGSVRLRGRMATPNCRTPPPQTAFMGPHWEASEVGPNSQRTSTHEPNGTPIENNKMNRKWALTIHMAGLEQCLLRGI